MTTDTFAGYSSMFKELSNKNRLPMILQTQHSECGLACLAMIASYYGNLIDMPEIRSLLNLSHKGMNFHDLIRASDKLELSSRALQCPIDDISELNLPCIAHWDFDHFVVIKKISKNNIIIHDPNLGIKKYTHQEFSMHFTGVVLELSPTKKFVKVDSRSKLKLNHLWMKIQGLGSSLISLILISLLIQVFALTTPFYLQISIDEVLTSADIDLLKVLAIGFTFLLIINIASITLRRYLILNLSSFISGQIGANLFSHLLKLPIEYYEQRHVGDILTRFNSLKVIKDRLTVGIIETVVDGVMAIAIIALMFYYSMTLTIIVLVVSLMYLAIRLCFYKPFYDATNDSISALAKEQSNFIENIRGIQTIKVFSAEPMRVSIWSNKYIASLSAEMKLNKIKINFDSLNLLIFGIENITIIYLAISYSMKGSMTIGMVVSYLSYKVLFTTRFSNLVEQIILFKILRLHLDRLSDIIFTKIEEHRKSIINIPRIFGSIELVNISFRYSESEDYILDNINMKIKSGESVAITGRSGCGKTTLLKIMLGVLQPTSGKVLIDGVELNKIGLDYYRKNTASVMQNDCLLAGTILDNISFFDQNIDKKFAYQCAIVASINDEINKMPMAFNTLIGDMGSNFSGGQLQRVLLARALYKKPKILFLDEATSHLDTDNEKRIVNEISNMDITVVAIAHREETIKNASRVIKLVDGSIISDLE
jgi:ATP-binding cassette subfamily B protein RaxB